MVKLNDDGVSVYDYTLVYFDDWLINVSAWGVDSENVLNTFICQMAREEIKKKLIIPEYNDVFEELLKETYEYNYKENDYDVLLSNFIDKNEDRLKRLKDELTLRVLKILKDFSDKLLDNHKEKYALKA